MELQMARFLKDQEQMLHYMARQNIVPVKAPQWADHPFELRRGQIGPPKISKGMIPVIMELLGIHDERSCREVRARIKRLRKSIGYRWIHIFGGK